MFITLKNSLVGMRICEGFGLHTSQMKLAKRSVARMDKMVLSLDASSVIA